MARHIRKFMLSDSAGQSQEAVRDTEAYEEIINNPLCRIIKCKDVKETIREYDDGKIISSTDYLYVIVEWEENTLRA